MNFTNEASPFIEFAGMLVDRAGSIIREHYRGSGAVETKADGSPVTRADRDAEAAMREMIARRFAGHGVLGEEHGEINPDAEYRWILDPIDGTKSFVLGIPMFCTLVALMRGRSPILGVIDQPVLGQRLVGDGHHATLNGERASLRLCPEVSQACLLTPDHFNVAKHRPGSGFDNLARAARIYRCIGDGYAYSLLATGWADVVIDPVVSLWDIAALAPVVRGAGGVISSWGGTDPLAADGIVAAGPYLHSKVMAVLHGAQGQREPRRG